MNVELITEWNPVVFLDLHGYVKRSDDYPGLIEPCTVPHNPNYEYDLFIKWALDQAEAMEQELVSNRDDYETDLYKNMQGTHIPYRDAEDGWDDYPPIFTPMYAMYHGAYGYTLETPTNSLDGVKWHVDAVMGALKFAVEHKEAMMKDQIEIFKRGIRFDHPEHEAGFFPKAYILPVDPADPTTTLKAVNHLLKHDIEVVRANQPFTVDGMDYEAGTYIVKMDQAKAGLANTLLSEGEDISDQANAMYDISAWSLPLLWGYEAVRTDTDIDVPVKKVTKTNRQGSLNGKGPYVIPNSSVEAVALVNKLLAEDVPIYRSGEGHFYVEEAYANAMRKSVRQAGLTLDSKPIPSDTELLRRPCVALSIGNEHGVRTALRHLGFDVSEVTPQEIAGR